MLRVYDVNDSKIVTTFCDRCHRSMVKHVSA